MKLDSRHFRYAQKTSDYFVIIRLLSNRIRPCPKQAKCCIPETGTGTPYSSSANQRMRHLEYAGQVWSPWVIAIGIGDPGALSGVQEMVLRIVAGLKRQNQGFTKRCRPANSALVYEPKCEGRGVGVAAGSQPMSTAVHMEPK
jgi:hypothetical protein